MNTAVKILMLVCTSCLVIACNQHNDQQSPPTEAYQSENRLQIGSMLNAFNKAAADADYTGYFNFYTEDATFNGTDATENWDKDSFMVWAKPFFDKKTTWNFTAIRRKIYFGNYADIAWFEELLSTQMKICRGSGVLVKRGNDWKVQQYVLSTTIPNSVLDTVIKIKTPVEDSLINKFQGN